MASTPEHNPALYGFTDLHGFKDFVGYVLLCAPELFPEVDWLKPDEQMNLERAFVGLRYGLVLAVKEKGDRSVFADCRVLVEESYRLYLAGESYEGQLKLERVSALLSRVRTQ